MRGAIDANYRWALGADYAEPRRCARFWYVSEEKLEPRLGERFEEPGAEKELPLAAARDIAALRASLGAFDADATLAEFLRAHPRHRHAVRRAQLAAQLPYAEIRDNVIAKELRPVDLLRCKLSFFGATRFDPKSDRWVRITMYQHAPFPDELSAMDADDWAYPPLGEDADDLLAQSNRAKRAQGRARRRVRLGAADETGRAVRWLHANGFRGAAALADWLDGDIKSSGAPRSLSGVWRAPRGALDPLRTGVALGDCIESAGAVETGAIAHPLLAAGFLGDAAHIDDWSLNCNGPARGCNACAAARAAAERAPRLRPRAPRI